MKKILLFILFFYLGAVLFMPKINLYYTLEGLLKKEHVEIKEGRLVDRWIDLKIEDATIFYDGIASVKMDDLTISPWLFYNKIVAQNIQPTTDIKRMINVKATEVEISYGVMDYQSIMIEAKGDFGLLHGTLNIFDRNLRLILEPSAKFKHHDIVRRYFKKEEEGLVYESKL
jgi:hypothetical protein